MTCQNCGKEIFDDDCPFCGSKAKNSMTVRLKSIMRSTSVKVIALVWTLYWILGINNMLQELEVVQAICVIIFGYFFFIPFGLFIIHMVKNWRKTGVQMPKASSALNANKVEERLHYDDLDGHEFEYFCAELLRANGFDNVEVTKGSGDQGVDILTEKDSIKYAIQCKCYTSDIGNKAVQEAFAGKTFYNRHIAVVMTNRYFTPSAKELADKNGVILWDRDKLNSLISNTQ